MTWFLQSIGNAAGEISVNNHTYAMKPGRSVAIDDISKNCRCAVKALRTVTSQYASTSRTVVVPQCQDGRGRSVPNGAGASPGQKTSASNQ